MTTTQEYYNDQSNWGQDQYITLADIINTIQATTDDDSYFKNVKPHVLSIHGKQAIKRLNVDLGLKQKAIQMYVQPSKIIPFPRYMTNWYRVNVINSCGKLQELNINNDPNVSDYILDNDGNLIFDNNGDILEANSFNGEYGTCLVRCDELCVKEECGQEFKDSWVKAVDKKYFEFSDDLVGKYVVIEYQTAGLESVKDCDIKIHQDLEFVITEYIKWKVLESKRNVPQAEALYHYNLYKLEKRRAKVLQAPKISIKQIVEAIQSRY